MFEQAQRPLIPPGWRRAGIVGSVALVVAMVLGAGVLMFADRGKSPPTAAGPTTSVATGSPIGSETARTSPASSGSSDSATPSARPAGTATPAASPTPRTGKDGELRLVVGGDVMLARTIGEHIRSDGPAWPFATLGSVLAKADLTLVNLECTMGTRGKPQPKHYRFRAPSAAAEALRLAGVDAVSQANNHAIDYGRAAFAQAQGLLADAGIAVAGAGVDRTAAHTPAILERNGVKLAILAYADVPVEVGGFGHQGWIATGDRSGVAWVDLPTLKRDVKAARKLADHVVVFFHFGYENRITPTATQKRQAHAAIDAGASLVVGAHPHVLQGTERYQGGLIVYSLGNFVFDGGGWAPVNRDSALLEVRFSADALQTFEWHPLVVRQDGRPRPATATESHRILRRLAPIR